MASVMGLIKSNRAYQAIEGLRLNKIIWEKVAYAALRPAGWGAGIGAVAGGIEGAFDDRETVVGGAFRGALAGGILGGVYGAGRSIYKQNLLMRANLYNNVPFRGKPVGPSGGFGGYLPAPSNYAALPNKIYGPEGKNSFLIEHGLFY